LTIALNAQAFVSGETSDVVVERSEVLHTSLSGEFVEVVVVKVVRVFLVLAGSFVRSFGWHRVFMLAVGVG
jgi:hypothetical protein